MSITDADRLALESLAAEVPAVRAAPEEINRLRDTARRAADDAEDMRDAVACLSRIGDLVGFGQADWGADDRARLVREVETALDLARKRGQAEMSAALERGAMTDAANIWPDWIYRIREMRAEVGRLRAAIREHRDQRLDDRCWLDDLILYAALGEPVSSDVTALPPKEDFLRSCERYWHQRQCPLDSLVPKGMTITQLEAEVERLRATLADRDATLDRWADGVSDVLAGRDLWPEAPAGLMLLVERLRGQPVPAGRGGGVMRGDPEEQTS